MRALKNSHTPSLVASLYPYIERGSVSRLADVVRATAAAAVDTASTAAAAANAPRQWRTTRAFSSTPQPAAAAGGQAGGGANAADPFGAPPPLPQRRVVVTGLGVVCPVGVGATASWQALLAGRTGTRRLLPEDLPESQRAAFDSLPSRVIAPVPADALLASPHYEEAGSARGRRSDYARFVDLALVAAAEALDDAGWRPETEAQRAATGVCIGAGIGSTADTADAGALIAAGRLKRVSPYFVPRILVNTAAGAVSARHGLRGPNHAPSTACATGAHAVGDAYRMVQRGDADVMLAGATEAAIDAIGLGGFSRMRALSTAHNDSPEAASRPFDAARDGFVMGEGAAVLVLEELEHAQARGARAYAEVRGYGLSGDAHHATAPRPDGGGAAAAMAGALARSGVPLAAVRHVNAHATSTPAGDEIEQAAIASVFGELATTAGSSGSSSDSSSSSTSSSSSDSSSSSSSSGGGASSHNRYRPPLPAVAVSSTKGATGHLLGAAGAVEAAFTVLAIAERVAPATANLTRPDPPLLAGLVMGAPVSLGDGSGGGQPAAIAALCNALGFGGTNASILFTTPPY